MNFALEQQNMSFAQFTPAPRINVVHSFRHYGHFVSGQHCAGGRGDVLPGCGIRSSVSSVLQPIVASNPKHKIRSDSNIVSKYVFKTTHLNLEYHQIHHASFSLARVATKDRQQLGGTLAFSNYALALSLQSMSTSEKFPQERIRYLVRISSGFSS